MEKKPDKIRNNNAANLHLTLECQGTIYGNTFQNSEGLVFPAFQVKTKYFNSDLRWEINLEMESETNHPFISIKFAKTQP